jgi:hypothetical protein
MTAVSGSCLSLLSIAIIISAQEQEDELYKNKGSHVNNKNAIVIVGNFHNDFQLVEEERESDRNASMRVVEYSENILGWK